MVNPFQIVAQKLGELGFYDFLLPWLITSAIIWGLLQKSKVFGENSIVINSVLSLSISFFVWGFLLSTGLNLVGPLSRFFTWISIMIVVFALALVASSLFYPKFTETLTQTFTGNTWVIVFLVVALILFILSGFVGTLTESLPKAGPGKDVIVLVIGLAVFVMILLAVASSE